MDNTPEVKAIKNRIDKIEQTLRQIGCALQFITVGIPEARATAHKIGREIFKEYDNES
jgi:hypothetical protein